MQWEDAKQIALQRAVEASVGQDYATKDIVGTAEEFALFLMKEESDGEAD